MHSRTFEYNGTSVTGSVTAGAVAAVTYDNDGRFPENCAIQVQYPRTPEQEKGAREAWPWLPAPCWSSAAQMSGECVSRSASWPCARTAASQLPAPRRTSCTTRAATGTPPS